MDNFIARYFRRGRRNANPPNGNLTSPCVHGWPTDLNLVIFNPAIPKDVSRIRKLIKNMSAFKKYHGHAFKIPFDRRLRPIFKIPKRLNHSAQGLAASAALPWVNIH